MGIFRTKKIDRYTEGELVAKTDELYVRISLYDVQTTRTSLTNLLHEWAEWREALARKRGENKSPLDREDR